MPPELPSAPGAPAGQVCVFCASALGASSRYQAAAVELARCLVAGGHGLVYGGGTVGLMGVVADAVLAAGGRVTGVIPRGLFSREVAHRGVTELIEVASMHERKQLMYELSDAFVGLPGGLGTLEEVAEIATWSQLGLHAKPIVLVDLDGYWSPLLTWMDGAVTAGFVKPANRSIIASVDRPGDVLTALADYRGPRGVPAVLAPGET